MRLVTATQDLIERFYGGPPKRTGRAWVILKDDAPIGVVGVYPDEGRYVLYSELNDEIRADKRFVVRAWRALEPVVKGLGVVHALADPVVPKSDSMLRHFGFVPKGRNVFVLGGN